MPKIRTLSLAVATVLAVAACSWGIKLDNHGRNVRTAWNDNVAGCRESGKVTVSVLDHIGPMDRRDLKVRDELEVLARNEAGKMGADTIRPLGEPRDGEQSFATYVCGNDRRGNAGDAPKREDRRAPAATETFPIRND